jgi:hypothetical protein
MLRILFVIQLLSPGGNEETSGEQRVSTDPQLPGERVTKSAETRILMFDGKSERQITPRHTSKVAARTPSATCGIR